MKTEQDRLEVLRDILFTDDRDYIEKISRRIQLLEKTVNSKEILLSKVDPIIINQLEEFTKNIPKTLGPVITATLKEEIKNSRDEVVDALYPILGKMVKKYVAQEMRLLSEKMDNQLGFFKGWNRKFGMMFKGKKEKERILSEMSSAKIEQVFLIEKDSGLLKASYSKNKTIDEEMVSAMLTAIKSFVEDAFDQKGQNLEMIEYELYHLQIQSFVSYYVVVAVSGNLSLDSKNKIQDVIFDFYHNFMEMNLDLVYKSKRLENKNVPISDQLLAEKLEQSFGNVKV